MFAICLIWKRSVQPWLMVVNVKYNTVHNITTIFSSFLQKSGKIMSAYIIMLQYEAEMFLIVAEH